MKKLKKVLAVLVAGLMLFTFASCGSSPESAVTSYLDSLVNADGDAINEALGTDNELKEIFGDTDLSKLFSSMTYEVVSTKETDENNAVVKVKITNKDIGSQMPKAYNEVYNYAFANAFSGKSEAELTKAVSKIFVKYVKKALDSDKTVTNEVSVKVKNGDDGWEIEENDELTNAILGGMLIGIDKATK